MNYYIQGSPDRAAEIKAAFESMIYIKSFLWVLGWVPVFILGLILCFVSVFSSPFIAMFYYIKNGDVETTPDKFLPMLCASQLENAYRKLEPKL